MIDRNSYMKKLEAEIEQAQAKMAEWKAKAKSAAADGSIEAEKTAEKVTDKAKDMSEDAVCLLYTSRCV